MEKIIYVIRHCEATGQNPYAHLTEKGIKQANSLANLLSGRRIERIISSPYARARQSIGPLAKKLNLTVEIDNRLREQQLKESPELHSDELIKKCLKYFYTSINESESSFAAMNRIVEVINDIINQSAKVTVIVTHGLLMTVLLKYYNNNFGYEDFLKLKRPDVYCIKYLNSKICIEHINPKV